MKKILCVLLVVVCVVVLASCEYDPTANASSVDRNQTISIGNRLAANQPTPNDIDYSLERYNLIRRAYWVNGQRERARQVICPISDIPLGYVTLFTESGWVIGQFVVEGKVSSLNSFLTPDSEYYEIVCGGSSYHYNNWLPDVDGSYGSNDNGIFFFTPDGKYIEWTGIYLYSDIPFDVGDPVLKYEQSEIGGNEDVG